MLFCAAGLHAASQTSTDSGGLADAVPSSVCSPAGTPDGTSVHAIADTAVNSTAHTSRPVANQHDIHVGSLSNSSQAVALAATGAAAAPAADTSVANAAAAPSIILLMSGIPGSGKSTFCAQLIAQGSARWVRVNQDSVNNGRKGSRQQCLAAARAAVLAGHSCVIDRCHPDAQQRSEFIKLAADLNIQVGCSCSQSISYTACTSIVRLSPFSHDPSAEHKAFNQHTESRVKHAFMPP